MSSPPRIPSIHTLAPLLALVLLAVGWFLPLGSVLVTLSVAALIVCVVAAVHHAEVIAHRVGEPFGTLVLALAVTVIEVALIVSLMLVGGAAKAALARDAVYAAIMIIANGVVGVCLLVGGLRHGEQAFRKDSSGPALGALAALATLSLVLPRFTTSAPGPFYSDSQLVFAALASLALWGAYVLFQTVGHRDYFLPIAGRGDPETHAEPPSNAQTWRSVALLLAALVAVVGLAKLLSPGIEAGLAAVGAPPMAAGIVISLLVLLPETWAAVRAAHADRLQSSMNLALGSALATIGLTIPAVVAISLALGLPLELGLEAKDIVLLFLTLLVAGFTLGAGRTTVMQGAVHLVLFAAFLFLALVP